jgi:molybdopterin-dependent oxidoreductase alpha subunit
VEDGKGGPAAGGLASVAATLRAVARGPGLLAGVDALARVNQEHGFDCPGCAWPDPPRRGAIEFCENGAKHVAHEATTLRVGPDFFARHGVTELLGRSDRWLEAQGRLTHPMWKPPGEEHYRALSWADAFARIGGALGRLSSPDEAVFYTSGRTSNEAAFLYQLFAREYGTNNLPDCSNLCHESSGTGLSDAIGVGKGTVSLEDFDHADLILILGQNPGTNHPRMFTTLLEAKRRGCRIVSVNPLRERALVRFAHPQDPLAIVSGRPISDLFLQVRVAGDVALLKGIQKELLALESERPGRVLDWDFLHTHTEGFGAWHEALGAVSFEELERESSISRAEMRRAAELYAEASSVIACWAMGLTQHRFAVANVQEIVNLLLLRGNLGRRGAGVCPVRGHSNVQGDRTMGIWERPTPAFLDRLGREFGFEPPRSHGLDTVDSLRALHEGRARVLFALGGNFAVATPDAAYTAEALRRCLLTAHVSTTLNRSHLVTGLEALILPCLGRTERDVQATGPQFVSVENSMSVVHRSQGHRPPASVELRSEPAIVAGLARAVLGARSRVPWEALGADYDRIRDRIARVVPGCEDMNARLRRPGGFTLPSGARTRHFDTPSGRARFRVHPVPRLELAPGQLLLTTLRSHDQFNTTVYSDDDRYRGIYGGRRVILLHPEDMKARGLGPGDLVDLTSHYEGETRSVQGFRVVAYDLPRGCAGAYYPEANALVPVRSVAEKSQTPTYKSIPITVART